MRLFVAINLPSEVRQSVWEAAAPLRAAGYPFRWVASDSLHLTLKFLGNVPPDRAPAILGSLETAARGAKAFLLPLSGFGAFPSPRRPRVVWAGCEGVPPLELLQHHLERELHALGFPLEGRPFRPHFTLGRLKHDVPMMLQGFAAALDGLVYEGEAMIRSVDLMESALRADGARYTVRHRVELAG